MESNSATFFLIVSLLFFSLCIGQNSEGNTATTTSTTQIKETGSTIPAAQTADSLYSEASDLYSKGDCMGAIGPANQAKELFENASDQEGEFKVNTLLEKIRQCAEISTTQEPASSTTTTITMMLSSRCIGCEGGMICGEINDQNEYCRCENESSNPGFDRCVLVTECPSCAKAESLLFKATEAYLNEDCLLMIDYSREAEKYCQEIGDQACLEKIKEMRGYCSGCVGSGCSNSSADNSSEFQAINEADKVYDTAVMLFEKGDYKNSRETVIPACAVYNRSNYSLNVLKCSVLLMEIDRKVQMIRNLADSSYDNGTRLYALVQENESAGYYVASLEGYKHVMTSALDAKTLYAEIGYEAGYRESLGLQGNVTQRIAGMEGPLLSEANESFSKGEAVEASCKDKYGDAERKACYEEALSHYRDAGGLYETLYTFARDSGGCFR